MDIFRVCDLYSCNLLTETVLIWVSFIVFSLWVTKEFSPGLEPRTIFRGCGLCSCDLPAQRNNVVLDSVFLSCLVIKLRKSSSGLEPRTILWDCGLCSCNFLVETNNFVLDDVLLSCLVSKLQEPFSPELELRILFGVLNILKSLPGIKA
jgi:hypothetical protein